jgi:dTDP-4-amino-4,6-dideoxygalactose transaminase
MGTARKAGVKVMRKKDLIKLQQVLHSAPLSFEAAAAGQDVIREFEQTTAQWLGVQFAVSVASGTLALTIALRAAGVTVGDEVIVSAYDWFAASAAVLHVGAVPVFADVDAQTYTLDPQSASERVSPKTRAIIATHLFGHPCDMAALRRVADEHGLRLVEDAAQALGAVCEGKKVGSWGDLACFSFGVRKLLSCGEGGLIVTNDAALAERVVALCQHPLRQRWEGVPLNPFALKAPMHPLAAALLLEQWRELPKRLAERQQAFQRLNEAMAEMPFLRPVVTRDGCEHACHRYSPIVLDGMSREGVVGALTAAGIPACGGFISEPVPKALGRALKAGHLSWHPTPERLSASSVRSTCPVTERLCRRAFALDWHVGHSAEDLRHLRTTLNNWTPEIVRDSSPTKLGLPTIGAY